MTPARVRSCRSTASPASSTQRSGRRRKCSPASGTLTASAAAWSARNGHDDAYDTVVCTFSLCAIPDHRAALAEMLRVLRPGGLLVLADHVASTSWPFRALQVAADAVSVPLAGEHFRRRPLRWVLDAGLAVERHERTRAGVIEWFAARTPGPRAR